MSSASSSIEPSASSAGHASEVEWISLWRSRSAAQRCRCFRSLVLSNHLPLAQQAMRLRVLIDLGLRESLSPPRATHGANRPPKPLASQLWQGELDEILIHALDASQPEASHDKTLTLARLLLEAGANPNSRDRAGRTPLIMALAFHRRPVFRLLLEAGANPMDYDATGRSLMHNLATRPTPTTDQDAIGMVRYLASLGLNVDHPNFIGHRPLHMAVILGNWGVAVQLLECGADPTLPCLSIKERPTSLHLMVMNPKAMVAGKPAPAVEKILERTPASAWAVVDANGHTPRELVAAGIRADMQSDLPVRKPNERWISIIDSIVLENTTTVSAPPRAVQPGMRL